MSDVAYIIAGAALMFLPCIFGTGVRMMFSFLSDKPGD